MKENDNLAATITQLTKKVESIEINKSKEVNTVSEETLCNICDMIGHSTEVCPTIPTVKQVLLDPDQVNFWNNYKRPQNSLFSETYNSEWRNHHKFRWGNSNTNNQNN